MPAALFVVFFLCLLSVLSGFSSHAFGSTPEPPARPFTYVVDLAHIIDENAQARLNAYLKELEMKTSAQVVLLTVESLDGDSIEDFSLRTAEKWKLGQKGKDNGVLITVSVKDHKYRFEIGYGLESILPDSMVGSIGREYLVPSFRKGDYSTGLFNATLAVIKTIAAHEGVEITGIPQIPKAVGEAPHRIGFLQGLLGIIIFIGLIYLFARHPGLLLFFLLSSGRGGGGGWSGGGGGGGFGGGGGGGFGGGGASGSW